LHSTQRIVNDLSDIPILHRYAQDACRFDGVLR
jgi:hypothetical protein